MTEQALTPSIGRIVHYNNFGIQEAAIVTGVHQTESMHVDLAVFPRNTMDTVVRATFVPFDASGEKKADVERLAQALEALGLPRIVTGHCTGKRAFGILRSLLGDRVEYLATGASVTI